MNEYLELFLKGFVATLPSIVAATGIIVNNVSSTARQRREREAKYKIELIEQIYAQYHDIINDFLVLRASIKKRLQSIQEEIVCKGTETEAIRYRTDLEDLAKRAILWATYKNNVIEVSNLDIDIDAVAKFLADDTERAIVCSRVLVRTMKWFIVEYYETGDMSQTLDKVICELEEDQNMFSKQDSFEKPHLSKKPDGMREERIREFSRVFDTFDDNERRKIMQHGDAIIDALAESISKNDTKPLDEFEKQVANVLKELLKQ